MYHAYYFAYRKFGFKNVGAKLHVVSVYIEECYASTQ